MTLSDPALEKYIVLALIETPHKQLAHLMRPDDFTVEHARVIHGKIIDRLEKGQAVDTNILGDPDISADTVMYCSDAVTGGMVTDDASHLLEKIMRMCELSDLRYASDKMAKAQRAIGDKITRHKDLLDFMTNLTNDLVSRHNIASDTSLGNSVNSALARIERMKQEPRIKTGIKAIDQFLHGGIALGEFVVFAARPNVGKSVFSIMPAIYSRLQTLIAVNEMDKESTSVRMLCHLSGVNIGAIEAVEPFIAGDGDALAMAYDRMAGMSIDFMENSYDPQDLEAVLRTRKQLGKPLQLVIVDMAGRMRDKSQRFGNRREELTSITGKLFRLAHQYHCTIIGTVQIHRASGGKPTLADLKESGSWEEDSDKVFLMWEDKDDPRKRHIMLAKNRTGDKGVEVEVMLDGRHMKFEEV